MTRCTARCPLHEHMSPEEAPKPRRHSRRTSGAAGVRGGGETRANICDGRGRSGKTATQREPHSGRFRP